MLSVNDTIPTSIKVINEEGEEVDLSQYLEKLLVIYFYPKDNTPGCTVEARAFRDLNRKLEKMGARVVGVSKDSFRSHQNFKKKLGLNFELLSDPEHKLQEAFGVWQEKRMMGRNYWGAVRATFLVDKKGKVLKVWPRVKPQDHAQEVLNYVESIQKK